VYFRSADNDCRSLYHLGRRTDLSFDRVAQEEWCEVMLQVYGVGLFTPASFRRSITIPPLPSANTFVNMFNMLTGFTHKVLSPYKFTPMPGVHL